MSHSRAWRRGRTGGAAVVACVTVFFPKALLKEVHGIEVDFDCDNNRLHSANNSDD